MSQTQTQTQTQMDISPNNILGTCNYKCNYFFKYNTSNTSATNYGSYISLSYDSQSMPPVIYNDTKYNVSSIQIYSPSLHLYNGSKVGGEFIILHNPIPGSKTGSPLNVCIPITNSGNGNPTSTNIITNIVDAVSSGAPSQGESTSQINEFSLNNVVPRKPFYSYESSKPDSTLVQQFVVFGIQDSIVIQPETLKQLNQLIPGNPTTFFSKVKDLFMNTKGPSLKTGDGDDEIYIDCRPTGVSEESSIVNVSTKSANKNDLGSYFSNPYFIFFIFALIFVGIIMGLNKYLTSQAHS
jgi:carbonic anhydrase